MSAAQVLEFWFSPESEPCWFEWSEALDQRSREMLEAKKAAAAAGRLDDWQQTAESALALVVLLDQVPRNLYRGSARAFASDAKALSVARAALARGFDRDLPEKQRLFLYLPFEHSEDSADQAESCRLFATLSDPEYLKYAEAHRDVIARFGRFPHRNAALGRASTPAEEAYLAEGEHDFAASQAPRP